MNCASREKDEIEGVEAREVRDVACLEVLILVADLPRLSNLDLILESLVRRLGVRDDLDDRRDGNEENDIAVNY